MMDKDYLTIARQLMPQINTISEMYSMAEKQGMFDYDGEFTIVGSTASTIKALNERRSRFYNDSFDDDEDKESDYIRFLENELKNLLLDIYHVHKNEFDEFANDASQLVTDDIISSMMKSV